MFFALLLGLLVHCSCYADKPSTDRLFKYVDRNGHVRYTDKRLHDGYVKLIKTWKGWKEPKPNLNVKENQQKFKALIMANSKKYSLPSWLVEAVIHAESYYDPLAISSAGAVGLMQLMPATARRYGVYNRQNPEQNIEGGVRYLKDLLIMFDGKLDLALAAYNAGENAVKKYGYRIPPYKETQNYVRKVTALSQRYKSRPI